ncbi:glycosyl transferase [Vibrio sp. R-1]|uniref:glycosyl transferase n=1 Tax=Vibrio cholerae TaxID=666 RepID=UPI001A9FBFA6|nr:glycosyl transferase [Vibrio cholerae]MBO1401290.1 glycosyl transferase [Vibrio cholerae]MCX9456674.1 glycosyl transferase [Vibrio cholerae]MEB3777429.1 glycosyl transferase [Vibrio sp. R-1]
MKILIVNYHFPPSTTAHSYRWALLRDYFLTQGHDVEVICGGLPSESDTDNGITRVNFPKTIKNNTANPKINPAVRNGNFKNIVMSIIKKLYRKIFWPDGLWHWLPFSMLEVYKIRNKKFDLVIGYSPTFSAVVSSFLYKSLNKKTKLVIDFGDPFSVSKEMPVNNYAIYDWLNRYIESVVFKSSTLVSLTNKRTFELYKYKYPWFLNFDIVPHLVNVADFYKNKEVVNEGFIRIGYVGAFHKNIREPKLVIEKLNQIGIDCLRFEFYGPLNGLTFNNSRFVNHYGVVDRDKAIRLSKAFDILINVENEDCPMTPSKIFECMATGKPIINFLSSTSISSFSGYPLVLNVDSDTPVDRIKEFILKNKNELLTLHEVEEILKGKTLKSVGDKYLSVVE